MSQALVIIDIQNDYFPDGNMELVGSEAAATKARKVLDHFREQNLPVIHVQHISKRPNATFFVANTPGVEIHSLVQPQPHEKHIVKHFPNAFRETELEETLKNLRIENVVVVGMMTHMCIDTSVRAANDLGFKVTLVGDACATRDLAFDGKTVPAEQVQVAYLAAIDGSFATVVSADELLNV